MLNEAGRKIGLSLFYSVQQIDQVNSSHTQKLLFWDIVWSWPAEHWNFSNRWKLCCHFNTRAELVLQCEGVSQRIALNFRKLQKLFWPFQEICKRKRIVAAPLTVFFLIWCRWLPDCPAPELDPGVVVILRWAPHLPHQELCHQQRPPATSLGASGIQAFFSCPL